VANTVEKCTKMKIEKKIKIFIYDTNKYM